MRMCIQQRVDEEVNGALVGALHNLVHIWKEMSRKTNSLNSTLRPFLILKGHLIIRSDVKSGYEQKVMKGLKS